jgi:drug/metabolite transporter (DMT)-like permease
VAPLRSTLRNFGVASLSGVVIAAAATPLHVSARGLGLAALSGALASGLGYALWYRALPDLSRFRAALVQLAVPVVTATGAWLLLGEPITARLVASAAMILGGILVACLVRAS